MPFVLVFQTLLYVVGFALLVTSHSVPKETSLPRRLFLQNSRFFSPSEALRSQQVTSLATLDSKLSTKTFPESHDNQKRKRQSIDRPCSDCKSHHLLDKSRHLKQTNAKGLFCASQWSQDEGRIYVSRHTVSGPRGSRNFTVTPKGVGWGGVGWGWRKGVYCGCWNKGYLCWESRNVESSLCFLTLTSTWPYGQ